MSAHVHQMPTTSTAAEEWCGCRPDNLCYPHRLTNLTAYLRAEADVMDEALFVPRETFDRMLANALSVLDAITAECLPADERTAR